MRGQDVDVEYADIMLMLMLNMQISEMEAFHTKLISTFNCSDLDFVLLLKPEVKRPHFVSVILAVPFTSYQYVFS